MLAIYRRSRLISDREGSFARLGTSRRRNRGISNEEYQFHGGVLATDSADFPESAKIVAEASKTANPIYLAESRCGPSETLAETWLVFNARA